MFVDDVAKVFVNLALEGRVVTLSELSLVDLIISDGVTEVASVIWAFSLIEELGSVESQRGQDFFSLVADTLTGLLASAWEFAWATIGFRRTVIGSWGANSRLASEAS